MKPYLTTPHIIKETAEGTTYCPIQDELFSVHRSVEVVGEITRESVYSLILQLRYLCHADPEKEVTMYINSPGGSVCDGLALYDVMGQGFPPFFRNGRYTDQRRKGSVHAEGGMIHGGELLRYASFRQRARGTRQGKERGV